MFILDILEQSPRCVSRNDNGTCVIVTLYYNSPAGPVVTAVFGHYSYAIIRVPIDAYAPGEEHSFWPELLLPG